MKYVIDKLPRFSFDVARVMDMGFGELAKDILITARAITPFDKGQLRSDSDTFRESQLKWRVRYHKEYALAQEKGVVNGHRVRNYTTAGTGSKYLKTAGDKVMQNAVNTLKKYGARAKA